MIQLKDALQQMERRDAYGRPVPFTVQICTCNEQTGEGGQILIFENVILSKNAGTVRKPKRPAPGATPPPEDDVWRTPTRKFFFLESKETRQAHIRLITGFNHQTVL